MSPPTVTAIIPTYRRPRLVRRAIESVLAQTYPHVRVLVCDNASGDALLEGTVPALGEGSDDCDSDDDDESDDDDDDSDDDDESDDDESDDDESDDD